MTQARFILRAAARRDLNTHVAYLAGEAGKDVALRFVASAEAAFRLFAASPHLGPAIHTRNAALADVRKWRISEFPNYLLFYRVETDAIRIFRVMHASQDWWAAFDLD